MAAAGEVVVVAAASRVAVVVMGTARVDGSCDSQGA